MNLLEREFIILKLEEIKKGAEKVKKSATDKDDHSWQWCYANYITQDIEKLIKQLYDVKIDR